MAIDCGSPLPAAFQPPGQSLPLTIYETKYMWHSRQEPRHLLAPSCILEYLFLRPSSPVPYPWAYIQVRRVLWCPAIAHAACIVCFSYLFQPLRLWTLVRHHVCQSPQGPSGPAQVFRCVPALPVYLLRYLHNHPLLPLTTQTSPPPRTTFHSCLPSG